MADSRLRFLVTGANGFVGRSLCAELFRQEYAVRAAVRSVNLRVDDYERLIVDSIDSGTDWSAALRGVDIVIHLAARVHVMKESAADPLAEFFRINLYGTENLARQAAHAGVKRLVYVSTIKVNGERTILPFTETDEPNPQDPYGVSKCETEQALHRVAAETGLEIVIVRPPLVYGAGVKGNFAQMLKVLRTGIPLPLGSVRNLRSLIFVGNLVDALIVCAMHPAAAGQTYLVSDGEDISTPDLLLRLGATMGHPARLVPCPVVLLQLGGRLLGKSLQVERLLGSLRVDSSKICRELYWAPPYSLQQGLCATSDRFLLRETA